MIEPLTLVNLRTLLEEEGFLLFLLHSCRLFGLSYSVIQEIDQITSNVY